MAIRSTDDVSVSASVYCCGSNMIFMWFMTLASSFNCVNWFGMYFAVIFFRLVI